MMLEKTTNIDEKFSWLNLLDNISTSHNKIEIYSREHKCSVQNLKNLIFDLFKDDIQSLIIGPCEIGVPWNDFADIIEDIDNFVIPTQLDSEYDNEFEVEFMKMMVENKIEYDYIGYCEVLNWNHLLELLLAVVINVNGTDSLKFYNSEGSYCFYPHPTCSVGIYYKEMNEKIERIIGNATRIGADVVYIKP